MPVAIVLSYGGRRPGFAQCKPGGDNPAQESGVIRGGLFGLCQVGFGGLEMACQDQRPTAFKSEPLSVATLFTAADRKRITATLIRLSAPIRYLAY